MHATATVPRWAGRAGSMRAELACWLAGAVFTGLLFFTLAGIEQTNGGSTGAEIEDAPVYAAMPDVPPPPPKPVEQTPPPEPTIPLAGIEAGPSDSPVKIAVALPEEEAFLPDVRSLPAVIEIGRFHPEFRPTTGIAGEIDHVYQQSEVDQRPKALRRVAPEIPGEVWDRATTLRVVLVFIVDTDGRAYNARVLASSGKPAFDDLVAQAVTSFWRFSPASRKGKKVKCIVQQPVRIALPGGSPFSVE